MQSGYRSCAAMLAGLLLGGALVGVYDRYAYRSKLNKCVQHIEERYDDLVFLNSMEEVTETLNTLTYLQRGKTDDLMSLNESDLNSQVYVLVGVFPEKAFSNTNSFELLRRFARYRTEHPVTNGNDEIDRSVREVLAKLNSR